MVRSRISAAVSQYRTCHALSASFLLTEVRERNQIHNTPNDIGGLAFELEAESASRPAAGSIAANHVLGVDSLAFTFRKYQITR